MLADKIVYTGFSDDEELIPLAEYCEENSKILVVLTPVVNEYKQPLIDAMGILQDDIWIYEIAMGMKVVLKSRARKYLECNSDAVLYEDINIWSGQKGYDK